MPWLKNEKANGFHLCEVKQFPAEPGRLKGLAAKGREVSESEQEQGEK